MAKYNQPASTPQLADRADATTNMEGGLAFDLSAKTKLYLYVSTSMVAEPRYYDPSGKEQLTAIIGLVGEVAKTDPEFVLKLAAYARNELYLRSAPVLLYVLAAGIPACKPFVRRYGPTIIRRADELTESVALWKILHGDIGDAAPTGSLPHAFKAGIADAFANFDEYNFAKYDRDGEVKLSDVIRLVHPAANRAADPLAPPQVRFEQARDRSALYKRIRTRTLQIPETWETVISAEGSSKEAWESVIPKMGYMALLRNLRNFVQKGVDLAPVIATLTDPKAVAKSKQFPYRFWSAYKELSGQSTSTARQYRDVAETGHVPAKVLKAISIAMDLSVANVPRWPGVTFIATDHSGSMDLPVSEKASTHNFEVGAVLSAMAHSISDDAIVGGFGDTFVPVALMPGNSILSGVERLRDADTGSSTNAWLAVDYLIQNKLKVDRICIFSDMQCYDSSGLGIDEVMREYQRSYGYQFGSLAQSVQKYRRTINPNVWVHSFDLAHYGTSQFPENQKRTGLYGGWSDKVLQLVPLIEKGGSALGNIEAVDHLAYPIRRQRQVVTSDEFEF
jgi:60 kDa SS-A/Ro ribonucleoprotein